LWKTKVNRFFDVKRSKLNVKDVTGRTAQDIADLLNKSVKINPMIFKQTSNQGVSKKQSSPNAEKIKNFTGDSKFEMLNDLFKLGIL
jgi:inner membrane protein involved in colicin E2 resistance